MSIVDSPYFDGLQFRLSESQRHLQVRAETRMRDLGASRDIIEHMHTMRLYFRVPYMLTSWCHDHSRQEIIETLADHLFSMKLLDDAADGDSDICALELLGHSLSFQAFAYKRIEELGNAGVCAMMSECIDRISSMQICAKLRPAKDISQWLEYARLYGGEFLKMYGTIAWRLGGVDENADYVEKFAFNFGMMITMSDDWRDYDRHGEREGNLRHLVYGSKISLSEIMEAADDIIAECSQAVSSLPFETGMHTLVDVYSKDLRRSLSSSILDA